MRVLVEGSRVAVLGVEKNSATFSSLPSARWDKRKMMYTYFRSPLSAVRLQLAAKQLDQPIIGNGDYDSLLADYLRMKDAQRWKTVQGSSVVAEMLAKSINPFDTQTVPWAHQVCAHLFLFDKPAALLAMEMGTGKTLVALQRILDIEPKRTLVVCPLAVCEVWKDEWETHVGDNNYVIVVLDDNGSERKAARLERETMLATAQGRPIIVIVNYESFWRPAMEKAVLEANFDMVIYDEVHKLKSPSGAASRFAGRLAWAIPNRLGLSGTPLPNNPLDGFGVWRALDPSIFGTVFQIFKKRFAKLGGFEGKQVVGWINQDKFIRLMDYLTFRVDADVLNLPEATDTVRYVTLDPETKSIYRELHKNFVADVEGGMVTAANALSRLMKLREVTCGFVIDDDGETRYLHNARALALAEVLEEIAGEPVVVFAEFREDVNRIKDVCIDLDLRYGEVTGDVKDTVGGRFPPDTDVLICQTRSGGLGLNLVAARHAVFYSVGFALSDHLQARRRVHRGGQYRTVTYTHLVAPGTVDEAVYVALKNKAEVIDSILNQIKGGHSGIRSEHVGAVRESGHEDQGTRRGAEGTQEGA